MGLTKQYLKYSPGATFGVVNGRQSNAILMESSRGTLAGAGHKLKPAKQLWIVAPALENVHVWDPRKEERVSVLAGDRHPVSALSLSPDQSQLAVGYDDGCVKLWSINAQRSHVTLSGHRSGITCLQYDQTGTRLVSGSKDTCAIVWDVVNESGLFRLKGHKGPLTACVFLSEYNVLVTSSKDTLVKLWDLETQHCFQTLVGHRSEVWSMEVVWREEGGRGRGRGEGKLITASGDRELRVFKILPGRLGGGEGGGGEKGLLGAGKRKLEDDVTPKGPVECVLGGVLRRTGKERAVLVRSDPQGRFLGCLSADGTLEVYQVRTGEELGLLLKKRTRKVQRRRRKEAGASASCDGGGDGASGEGEGEAPKLSVADEFPLLQSIKFGSGVRTFDVINQPNGVLAILLALQNNSMEVHSVNTLAHPFIISLSSSLSSPGHRSDVRTLCFSSDDTCIASGSAEMVKVWNRATRRCIRTMPSGYATCSTFVPGDRHLLIGTKTGGLELFDIASGDLLEGLEAHEGAVWSMALSPDKRGFVTGSADHNVKFWEFDLVSDENRKKLTVLHVKTLQMSEDVLCVCYSPDQRVLAVGLIDCTVKIFFADSLKFFLSLYGHKLPVLSMDISSDSTLLATCSADKNIKIWGLDFGDCHRSIFAHDDSITSLRFVPKTHLLFSASKDTTVKCWDTDTFQHISTLEGHKGEVWCIAVSSDGESVVSGSHDFSLRLWERTDEPLILSEEREEEREAQFEEAAVESSEPVLAGETQESEAAMAGKKTMETVKATERLMEAIEVYREEKRKFDKHAMECKMAGKELPVPALAPELVATGNTKPERYVLGVIKKVPSSELEETLLVLPFAYVVDLLQLLDTWTQRGWETELSCRCLLFLLRIHHNQIVTNQMLLSVIDSLRQHAAPQVQELKDLVGFNLAGLHFLEQELRLAGTAVFADVSEQLQKIKKQKKLIAYT